MIRCSIPGLAWQNFGTFVDTGSPGKQQLPMERFGGNVTFALVDLNLLGRQRSGHLSIVLKVIIEKLAAESIRPVKPVVEMLLTVIETAFQQLQARKSIGKVVLSTEHARVPIRPSKVPQATFDAVQPSG